jgi:hypothetical protein
MANATKGDYELGYGKPPRNEAESARAQSPRPAAGPPAAG